MHLPESVSKMLAQPCSLVRASLLCVMLLGYQGMVLTALLPEMVAQAAPPGSGVHPTRFVLARPATSTAVNKTTAVGKTAAAKTHSASKPSASRPSSASKKVVAHGRATISPLRKATAAAQALAPDTLTATATDTVTPTTTAGTGAPILTETVTPTTTVGTEAPILTGTVTPTATVETGAPILTGTVTSGVQPKPSLAITKTHAGGDNFVVGQPIVYTIIVNDLPNSGPENIVNSITVTDVLPLGLTQIVGSSSNWNITISQTTSPAVMTATYAGSYPVTPGQVLPPIILSGTLTNDAKSTFSSTAVVTSPDDPSQSNDNVAIDTVYVTPTGPETPIVNQAPAGPETPIVNQAPTGPGTPIVNQAPAGSVGGTKHLPDLSIVKTNLGGNQFKAGEQITYVFVVSNLPNADPVEMQDPISVSDVIPRGETNLQAQSSDHNWSFSFSQTTSPAVITARYTGLYPVQPGMTLPSFTIMATLTNDAAPGITDTATVDTPGNRGTHATATDTVFVQPHNNNNSNNSNSNNNNNSNSNNSNSNHSNNSNSNSNNHNSNSNHSNNHNNNSNSNNSNNNSNHSNNPGLPGTGSEMPATMDIR